MYKNNAELADTLASAIKRTHMTFLHVHTHTCPCCALPLLAHREEGMGFCPKCGKMPIKEEKRNG
jgi:uncharacterized Zn finger protein (UPF0148 family)